MVHFILFLQNYKNFLKPPRKYHFITIHAVKHGLQTYIMRFNSSIFQFFNFSILHFFFFSTTEKTRF